MDILNQNLTILFFLKDLRMRLLFYVDDLVICGIGSVLIDQLKSVLKMKGPW